MHESENSPEQEEAGRAITEAAEKGATLTRQLLNFSRRRVTRSSPLDLNEAMHGTERMLRRLIGENIVLTMILGDDVPHVLAEAGQLEQVLVNLVVNARDAIGDQGEISISTEAMEANQLRCAPGNHPSGARLRVADNGCGVSAEVQAQIFEPFFTTKEAGDGTGLGLATVYGIVQQNEGEIHVESQLGVGTIFEIDLPGVEAYAEVAMPLEGVAITARRGGTILLAEDDEAVRELTRRILTKAGYDILAAEDGEAALELAAAHPGTIELLLTDVVMPRMGGHELARQIRARRPEIDVVFMSGFPELKGHRFSDLDQFEGARLLDKPFTRSELLAAIGGPADLTS